MSLFSRSEDLPGIHGTVRDCRPNSKGWKKLSKGDIAVIDVPNISRTMAQQLIDAAPAAVVNAAAFSTGSVPNFGPQLLLAADIFLVDKMGEEIWDKLKSSKKGRLTGDGSLFYGEKLLGSGEVVDLPGAEQQFDDAQQALLEHLEAYFGNTVQFVQSEAPLLIDGLGIPDSGAILNGCKVVVLSPNENLREQITKLRPFIREYDPALVTVDSAADTLIDMGYVPTIMVGDPESVRADTLICGASVVLPADPDGHATGLERIQDLGIGAMTFPAAVDSSTDLALLLADFHDAEMIVLAAENVDLDTIFSGTADSSPGTLLIRAKVAPKLVNAEVIADLYQVRPISGLGWLWAFIGLLVLCAVVVLVVGFTGDQGFTQNLMDTWNQIYAYFQQLFK